MKPAPFRYFAPTSLDECVDLLGEHGDEAKLLAGGQSLVPMMNFRLAKPAALIDLNGVSELAYVGETASGGMRIGALTRQRALERDPELRRRNPLLAEAIPYIGHFQIRNRGTVGGSIAHADPAAELPAVLCALDGSIRVQGAGRERTIAAVDFFQTYFTADLGPDEVVTEIVLPPWHSGDGWSVQELSRRYGDFALVGVACRLRVDAEGNVTDGAAALFGVGGAPVVPEAVAQLVGTRAEEATLAAVSAAVAAELDPESDVHASASYRRHLAGVLTRRALGEAYARANGGAG